MTPALQESWNEVAAELNSIPLVLEHKRYAAAIKPILALPRESHVLEAGCGAGRILRSLAGLGYCNLTGMEISMSRLRYMRHAGPDCARLVCSDQVPFANGTFDAVVSAAVIEHVPDPKAWLAELARVTRPGGIVSITSDTYIWRWLKTLGLYRTIQPMDDAIWPWHLISWARQAGLKVVGCGGFVNVDNQRWYFVRQLKRLTSMRRWWRIYRGVKRLPSAPGCPEGPPPNEVEMIGRAAEQFPYARQIDMPACIWSYENYFWFIKPGGKRLR
jgi:SAM-dependent methyltransferase